MSHSRVKTAPALSVEAAEEGWTVGGRRWGAPVFIQPYPVDSLIATCA